MDERDDGAYSRAPQVEDLVRICRSLNQRQARYLLIGGFAVIAHGAGRTTKDIDFLIDASAENVSRVRLALAILADNAAAEILDTDMERYTMERVDCGARPPASSAKRALDYTRAFAVT